MGLKKEISTEGSSFSSHQKIVELAEEKTEEDSGFDNVLKRK